MLLAEAKGWFLAAQRDEKEDAPLPFYDERGLDAQRADYSNAVWSWNQVLEPHLRAPGQPKQKITVVYGPAGDYPDVADALRALGVAFSKRQ
jgi:hypothetical protein